MYGSFNSLTNSGVGPSELRSHSAIKVRAAAQSGKLSDQAIYGSWSFRDLGTIAYSNARLNANFLQSFSVFGRNYSLFSFQYLAFGRVLGDTEQEYPPGQRE